MPNITYSQAIYDTLREEMERDPAVFIMGEDIGRFGGTFGVTRDLVDIFGESRVRDTPISENGIIGAAIGAALVGMRPIVEIMFDDFLPMAGDQIVNQLAKIRYMSGGRANVPVVIRTTTGAPRSAAAQHSQSAESWLMNVPGLKIVTPATPADAKGLLRTAIRGLDPVIFFEHKKLYDEAGDVPDGDYTTPFGVANVVREGRDVTIIALNGMLPHALDAAATLMGQGITAEVIDPRTLVPFDLDTIVKSVQKTGRAIITHEAHQRSGAGAEIAALLAEHALDWLDAPILRVGAKNAPIPYAPELESAILPDATDIVRAVARIVPVSTPR
jgi:acetoin:2,6-dichlorophenolindophenol oxidoreductase subunit beta